MVTQEQVKDITDRAQALYTYLDIERKKIEFEEEDLRTQAPDFWDDPERARAQMKVVGELRKWIEGYNEVRSSADELQLSMEFYRDEMVTEEEVDAAYDRDAQTQGIETFNDYVLHDQRVERVILPLRDGLTLIRKR